MLLKLEDMTTEQKLGMLYCARPKKAEDMEYTLALIKKRALGSVQLPPQRQDYVKRVREAADYPIIIVCDTESGFPTSTKQHIPLISLAACGKPEYFEVFAKAVATDARKAGYNATWGPVVDILDMNGPGRVHRRISDDPQKVCQAAEIIAGVYKRNGYMSCGKHYPGGVSLPYDNHMAPTSSLSDMEDLQNKSLEPYRYLMERGLLPSIMTTHRKFEKIDPEFPGTLSPKIQSIIREMGFDGVTWSDSFAMLSILQQYGEENVLGMAIAAGVDVVLPNYRTPVAVSWGHLLKNYADGMFTEERLNQAAERVIKLMNTLAEIPETVDVFTPEDQQLYDSIAQASVTAVCDPGCEAKLNTDTRKLFIVLTPNDFNAKEEELFEISDKTWYHPAKVANKIREVFPDAGIAFLPEFPHKKDNERVLVESTKYDEVVFVSFCETGAYTGTDCLTRRAESVIDALILGDKLAAIVHFGNPFALEPILHAKRKIFGYRMPGAQDCAIEALAGYFVPQGKLPFRVNFR